MQPIKLGKSKFLNSFSNLMAFVNKDDENKEDYQILGSQFDFTDRKTLAIKTPRGVEEYSFNPHSFDQLAGMLKIPTKYLESCRVSGKGGMRDQIEARMEERVANEHIVRVRKVPMSDGVSGVIRAILPGDHTLFDYNKAVPALQRAVNESGVNFSLEMSNVQDPKSIETSMHLRFVQSTAFDFPEIGISDPHKMGFHVRFSEVGEGPISLSALVWRLICSNGMMGWGDSEVVKLSLKNLQPHEVFPQLAEGVLASTRQEGPMRDMLMRKYQEPVAEPETALMLMAGRMKVGDHIKEAAVEALKIETKRRGEVTRFDLIQAFTRVAHSLSITERLRLETAVGKHAFGGSVAIRESVAANARNEQQD